MEKSVVTQPPTPKSLQQRTWSSLAPLQLHRRQQYRPTSSLSLTLSLSKKNKNLSVTSLSLCQMRQCWNHRINSKLELLTRSTGHTHFRTSEFGKALMTSASAKCMKKKNERNWDGDDEDGTALVHHCPEFVVTSTGSCVSWINLLRRKCDDDHLLTKTHQQIDPKIVTRFLPMNPMWPGGFTHSLTHLLICDSSNKMWGVVMSCYKAVMMLK